MAHPKIDNVVTGLVLAFDADTGDVVHVHERLAESIDGAEVKQTLVDRDTCEAIRCEVADVHPRRRIDAIAVSADIAGAEEGTLHVDPMTRQARRIRPTK